MRLHPDLAESAGLEAFLCLGLCIIYIYLIFPQICASRVLAKEGSKMPPYPAKPIFTFLLRIRGLQRLNVVARQYTTSQAFQREETCHFISWKAREASNSRTCLLVSRDTLISRNSSSKPSRMRDLAQHTRLRAHSPRNLRTDPLTPEPPRLEPPSRRKSLAADNKPTRYRN